MPALQASEIGVVRRSIRHQAACNLADPEISNQRALKYGDFSTFALYGIAISGFRAAIWRIFGTQLRFFTELTQPEPRMGGSSADGGRVLGVAPQGPSPAKMRVGPRKVLAGAR